MKPAIVDGPVTVYHGDALDVLRRLPDESVHCVVTSPPYWGLRDYGTAEWDGGDPACHHRVGTQVVMKPPPGGRVTPVELGGMRPGADASICRLCGARRIDSQLGLEPTPAEYVQRLVVLFREVRRVLRSDGTCWLNLGDCYAGSMGAQSRDNHTGDAASTLDGGLRTKGRSLLAWQAEGAPTGTMRDSVKRTPGLKPKDLIGMPWRVALELQADGWWLRSDIVWSKPNPMPSSARDRPTVAHEYVFLLAKSRTYFYDQDAVREAAVWPGGNRSVLDAMPSHMPGAPVHRGLRRAAKRRTVRAGIDPRGGGQGTGVVQWDPDGRNLRDVWEIPTQSYPGSHFATYPEALVVPCIKAGCPEGGVVLDPFAGSGTTLAVARRLGRRAVGIELSGEYLGLIRQRVAAASLPLLEAIS